MTSEPPTAEEPSGPPVESQEELYRALTTNNWWHEEEQKVSSAAFSFPHFSVDIVSIAGSERHTLSRFADDTGLVIFNCGEARKVGCDVRQEVDPNFPDNTAHANAYMPKSSGQRKKVAKQMAVVVCKLLHKPNITPRTTHPDPPPSDNVPSAS